MTLIFISLNFDCTDNFTIFNRKNPKFVRKALGAVDEIKRVFVDFQQHLYNEMVAQ
jgi:hypothetical protein